MTWRELKIMVICFILGLVTAISISCAIKDAVNGRDYNWQTTKQYREAVSEGKR